MGIEYTTASWYTFSGCVEKSAGCANCWARAMAWRMQHNPATAKRYEGLVEKLPNGKLKWTGRINLFPSLYVGSPMSWKKPHRIAVDFMGDLFDPRVSFGHVRDVFGVMQECPRHRFLILTKCPERFLDYQHEERETPMDHVWIGCSVENQAMANERRAAMEDISFHGWNTWVSAEPLLESVDFKWWEFLDFITPGGESGPDARPCCADWIRRVLNWSRAAIVACYVKQLGAMAYSGQDRIARHGLNKFKVEIPDGWYHALRDKKGANPSEWPLDLRVRDLPKGLEL